ncbi:hypothetical protein [Methylobacterium isbiliense]|jgi:hypothetical protein|uniref:hypothetical protein n=1 Tax=Methylobacterium isbiliense TaxID=315478 RepID=UPI0025B47D5F|nr:hypothetical protein [Methylobacterium isbiliense]MDN3627421.1 hypothetical protein [Methylobacterium isbiliense]
MIALSERFFRGAQELDLFLRAVRAEMDPESRGGPTFDNPDDLEAYLLSAMA